MVLICMFMCERQIRPDQTFEPALNVHVAKMMQHYLNGKLLGANNIYSRIFLRPSRRAWLVLDPFLCHITNVAVRSSELIVFLEPANRIRAIVATTPLHTFPPVACVASLALIGPVDGHQI